MKLRPEKIAEILHILDNEYLLKGELSKLVAYEDENYRLDAINGARFIVKISLNPEEKDFIIAQNNVLLSLKGNNFPKPIKAKTGNYHVDIMRNGSFVPLRVFPFIEGWFLGEIIPADDLFSHFGEFLGELDLELNNMESPALLSHSHEWDLARFQELKHLVKFVDDPEMKRMILYFFMKHTEEVIPVYHQLPKGLIHGDANEWNVITANQHKIRGLIDFGDMTVSARVHEIAIALAYSLPKAENPVKASCLFVKEYNRKIALSSTEISVLYYLIAARMCTSLVHAAKMSHKQANSEYHQISVQPLQSLLKKWIRINPLLFEREISDACGMDNPEQTSNNNN